jgi:hypothetical protein
MTWWPGWNSADSVGFWSHFWFWFGIACLFVAGASQVISHIYRLRKDALVAHKLLVLTNRVADRQGKADEGRHRADVGAAQKEPEQASTSEQKGATARVLTLEQQQTLIADLSSFAGQKVRVDTVMGSEDRLALAKDFVEIFRAAKWDVDPLSPLQVAYKEPPVGLEPTINQAGSVPPAFPALVGTLAVLGLGASTGFTDEQTPVGIIDMKIGVQASPTEK